jgi:hypothetical protein
VRRTRRVGVETGDLAAVVDLERHCGLRAGNLDVHEPPAAGAQEAVRREPLVVVVKPTICPWLLMSTVS